MKLLIDIGNTRIKWATCIDGSLMESGEWVHESPDEIGTLQFPDNMAGEPERVLAANVAGRAMGEKFAAAVRARWSLAVEFAETQPAAGEIRNGYDDYRQMGVDRWLAILATCDRYSRAACIVDAGTAVTIDQVDNTGRHLGGIIMPGLDLMRRSLVTDTGDIERMTGFAYGDGDSDGDKERQSARSIFGRSTGEAIGGGALSAISSLIEDCVKQMSSEYGDSALVMTGGDAARIIRALRVDADHRPLLVLEGLARYSQV